MVNKAAKKGVSIVATIGMMLILSLIGIVGVSLLGSTGTLAADYLQSQQAFYIAEAGLDWYTEQLEADTDWSDNTGGITKNFNGGSFTITVSSPQTDSIQVQSAASVSGYEGQPVKRTLEFRAERSLDFLNYVIYASGNINDADATGLVITGNQKENASVMPTADFLYYESIATTRVYTDKIFTAGTYFGNWYVDGNVTIQSGVLFYGGIFATGDVSMSGASNVTIGMGPPISSIPTLVCNGNLLFQGASNVNLVGVIYVGADMSGNFESQQAEDVNITGIMIVSGNLNLQETDDVNITYQAPLSCLGLSGGGGLSKTEWKESI